MAKKTNKTSHVLNLITGSQPPVTSSGETQPSAQASGETQQKGSAAEEPVRVPSANVTVVDPREERKLAEEIQKNLIQELEKEQTEEQAEQPREQEEQSEEQAEQPREQEEQSEEQSEEQTEEQTEQPKTNAGTPVQKEPEQQEEQKQEDGPSYRVVNIMEEILTPELILDALKSNGTCTCSRCQADVKALMLTRLPPKYIVADNTTVPMLLTFYRNKFRVAVLSQSIRACMEVKEHPRHIL